MATAVSSAQHFIECEECEENPAQFLCRTCPGHLCETCKTDHESKKITRNHEIIHLHENREGALGILHCEKHSANKLEWYCSPCKEPLCSKCLLESHNGHKMEDLAAKYQEMKSKLKAKKEEIEGVLLPIYKKLSYAEKSKKSEIVQRTAKVKKQIEDHTKSIIEQVTMLKENAIQNLQQEEKEALKAVEDNKNEIERRIETLGRLHESIIKMLGGNLGIKFFTNIIFKTLEDKEEFPSTLDYQLVDFQPGKLFITENLFGKSPKFSKSKETELQLEELSKKMKDALAMKQEVEKLKLKLTVRQRRPEYRRIKDRVATLQRSIANLERQFE